MRIRHPMARRATCGTTAFAVADAPRQFAVAYTPTPACPTEAVALSFLCGAWPPSFRSRAGAGSPGSRSRRRPCSPLSLDIGSGWLFGALRREVPDHARPFRLPGGVVLAPAAFIVANELILFSGWAVVWKLIAAILIGFVLLAISAATSAPEHRPAIEWRAGTWLVPYLIGLGVISYLSSFDTGTPSSVLGLHGPTNDLHFGWDVLVMAVFSLAVYMVAVRMRLPRAEIEQNVGDVTAEAEAEEAAVALPTP